MEATARSAREVLSSSATPFLEAAARSGACWHCLLRTCTGFEGHHEPFEATLEELQSSLRNAGEDLLPTFSELFVPRQKVCTLCLGLFPVCVVEDAAGSSSSQGDGGLKIVRSCTEVVRASGHKVSSFRLSISLPSSVTVREAAVMHDEEALPGSSRGLPVDLKGTLQTALADRLATALGVPHNPASDFWIEVTVRDSAGDLEAACALQLATKDEGNGGGWGGRGGGGGGSTGGWKRQRRQAHPPVEGTFRLSQGAAGKALSKPTAEQKEALRAWHADGVPSIGDRSCGGVAAGGEPPSLEVGVRRESIFIQGRYVKLSREVPQSPWMVDDDAILDAASSSTAGGRAGANGEASTDGGGGAGASSNGRADSSSGGASSGSVASSGDAGASSKGGGGGGAGLDSTAVNSCGGGGGRKGLWSVHEIVGEPFEPLVERGDAGRVKLHGAGREDIDVRMLGRGRPFVLELVGCLHGAAAVAAALPALQADVNAATGRNEGGMVEAYDMKVVPRGLYDVMAVEAAEKRKWYCCVVWTSGTVSTERLVALEAMTDLKVQQKTPIRVLHRRTLSIREKMIHSMRCERINDHFFVLRLSTSAGTYVKEFVHGDLGRTAPSVGSLLGCRADILQLDVDKVEVNAAAAPTADAVAAATVGGSGEAIRTDVGESFRNDGGRETVGNDGGGGGEGGCGGESGSYGGRTLEGAVETAGEGAAVAVAAAAANG
ncbi:unnamed protein product [Phaeothamnion confervicola]